MINVETVQVANTDEPLHSPCQYTDKWVMFFIGSDIYAP